MKIEPRITGTKTLDLPVELELKQLGETGTFSGYAAIFGNVDLGGDVIERGAFKEFVTTKDNQVRVLYQHDSRNPIGKAQVREDARGLYFDGTLVLEDALARKAYSYMKAGILDGMSIGYDVLPNGSNEDAADVRHLTALKLWEISPVTFGMNPLAQIEQVKAALGIHTKRDLEDFLRDAGFSLSRAKRIASVGWTEQEGHRDDDADAREVREMMSFLKIVKDK
mgnify:CR=1 FL=1